VNRKIDLTREKSRLDLLDPHGLAAGLPHRPRPIAGGEDCLALDHQAGVGCAQQSRHVIGLPQCQDTAPRADDNAIGAHATIF